MQTSYGFRLCVTHSLTKAVGTMAAQQLTDSPTGVGVVYLSILCFSLALLPTRLQPTHASFLLLPTLNRLSPKKRPTRSSRPGRCTGDFNRHNMPLTLCES